MEVLAMPRLSRKAKRWIVIAAAVIACGGMINFAIAQSGISLDSPVSFPVDI